MEPTPFGEGRRPSVSVSTSEEPEDQDLSGDTAAEQAWLADLTSAITGLTRATHSDRLYNAMAKAAGFDIRPYLLGVLTRLGELQPARVSDLAEAMDYDRSTVSRHVAELAELGCVHRHTDEADGRAVILSLTELGETVVKQVFQAWMDFLRGSTSNWSDLERSLFLTLLERFHESIESRVKFL